MNRIWWCWGSGYHFRGLIWAAGETDDKRVHAARTDLHCAGVCAYACVCGEFPRLKGSIETHHLIAMQRGPAAFTWLWRLKYLPLCLWGGILTDRSISSPLRLQVPTSVSLNLQPSFFPSPIAPQALGAIDNRPFEWQILILSHSNDICSPSSITHDQNVTGRFTSAYATKQSLFSSDA